MPTSFWPRTVEKHLPTELCSALDALDRVRRDAILSRPAAVMKMKGLKASAVSDGAAVVAFDVDSPDADIKHFELRTIHRVSNGAEAVLALAMVAPEKTWGAVEVWMKYEDGEWRVTEIPDPSGYGSLDLEDPDTIADLVHSPEHESEAGAVENLRTLELALVVYRARFPDLGFPDKLDVLGGNAEDDPNADDFLFIDSELAKTHMKNGYKFDYQRMSHDSFTIVARPLEFGKTGGKNFFVDESGVVRVTAEDREATVSDPPLS